MNPATERSVRAPHHVFTERTAGADPLGGLGLDAALAVYRAMLLARLSDEAEAGLVARGEAGFHLSCAGHEAMAAFGPLLRADDWLHLHYRDKALCLARGVPVGQYLHDLLANASSSSRGRQMFPFLADAPRRLLAQNVPVGDHALQAVGVAAAEKDRGSDALVLCSMGDGATQQGEVLEAMGEAVRSALPVVFVVEDNRYAISTPTAGRTFYSLPEGYGTPPALFGLPIHRIDGRDPVALHDGLAPLVASVRSGRGPALAVVDLERLCNHTNADDERLYRDEAERAAARAESDPLRAFERRLIAAGIGEETLAEVRRQAEREVARAVEDALAVGDPAPEITARRPLRAPQPETAGPPLGERRTMLEAIREVLADRLGSDPRVVLYGQDIEDPKGDVFGVTRGLSTAHPGRVRNAPLAESTIVGTSIGRALAGQRPVAFLQFADFLPVAFNQILSELGSMWWRTAGAWECPVILMIACGGFRPGLGPFHSQTMEALLAHVPGLDVLMPSTADDAAGLLQAAFESGRPTAFLYPKSCLNDPDRAMTTAPAARRLPLGRSRHARRGNDLTLVTWGATVPVAERVADALATCGMSVDLIDLRSIAPWDAEAVVASARRTGTLLVAHEDNATCGFGSEVVATVCERLGGRVRVRRLTRPDTYVPCNYANQLEILPSFRRMLTAAAEMLGLALSWEAPASAAPGQPVTIEARGTSPADQNVKVVAWRARPGAVLRAGDPLAELEADKAVFEFVSPVAGTLIELLVAEGETVRVGAPLARVALEAGVGAPRLRAATVEPIPHLTRPDRVAQGIASSSPRQDLDLVAVATPAAALGSRVVTNEELIQRFPGKSVDDIRQRTGIVARRRLGDGESALSLGVRAARAALERAGVGLDAVDALICSTTSPRFATPSLACLILEELGRGQPARMIPAFDVLAACSGYLYALGAAHDLIRACPEARVLVVTAEALSPLADPDDFDTAILFGDAATATLVAAPGSIAEPAGLLHRPVLAARGEPGQVLRVPTAGAGFLRMEGLKVYAEAVRQMINMLRQACESAGRRVEDLDLIVPHQANARIIGDIRMRLDLPPERLCVALEKVGNTSSSSIPLALSGLGGRLPGLVGLTAFGGGYTFGAALLEGPRPS